MKFYEIKPGLRGIENIAGQPVTFSELYGTRIWDPSYTEGLNILTATRTFCLHAPGRRFKVSDTFPWRMLHPKYLDRASFGEKSVVSIMEEEYATAEGAEFILIHPIDFPRETYALPINHFINPRLTKEELTKIASPIERGLGRKEALDHKVLFSLLEENSDIVKEVVEYAFAHNTSGSLPLEITIKDAGCYGATMFATTGYSEGFRITNQSFKEKLLFFIP
ncbi:hypothetical protein HZA98_01755 [Candidatus Woesearchaeota archaeon]|nr:hypothetical protein [Candidatus Woesearchaeota archaeon]